MSARRGAGVGTVVNLATDGSGNSTSTAADVEAAVEAHGTAGEMVTVESSLGAIRDEAERRAEVRLPREK